MVKTRYHKTKRNYNGNRFRENRVKDGTTNIRAKMHSKEIDYCDKLKNGVVENLDRQRYTGPLRH